MEYVAKNICWRSRQFGTSAEVSARHFGIGAELSRHFGTSRMVPKFLGSEVSWVQSVLTPFGTGAGHWCQSVHKTSAELSGHIRTSAEVSCGHFGTKEDIAVPGNTGPSHGKEDSCACVITRIN